MKKLIITLLGENSPINSTTAGFLFMIAGVAYLVYTILNTFF
jgi:hypothetical protein